VKCVVCAGEFSGKRRDSKFCSTRCRGKWDRARTKATRLEAHRAYHREYARRRRKKLGGQAALYGLKPQDVEIMMAAQGGRCAICKETFVRKHHIDHCHATGKVRGLLCHGCNTGIGMFKENPAALLAAADYVKAKFG
jgi:hypothetical protein